MTAREIYNAEKRKFEETYGINFSIENFQLARAKFRVMKNFTFKLQNKNEPFNSYADTLSAALAAYMNKLTKMEGSKLYNTSNLSIGNFIKDFESLFDKKYVADLKEGSLARRAYYNGSSFSEVGTAVWNRIKHWNKPLPEVWANRIVGKRFSVDQMKEVTAAAITNLANVRSERDLSENQKRDLTNIVLAQKAMTALREKRGTWFKIRHFLDNGSEKKYLKALTDQVNSYRQMGLPVDSIADAYSKTLLVEAKANLDIDIENNGKAPAAKVEEKKQEATATLTSAKQANQLFADKTLSAAIKGQIGDLIGKISSNDILNDMTRDMLYDGAVKDIKTMWTHFENNKGFDKEAHMKNSANGIFLNVQLKLSMLSKNPKDRIVTAQRITDLMLKQYSPVASDPQYEKYGDNYYIKNTDAQTVKRTMQLKDNAIEAIDEAKLDLGINQKVQLNVINDINENANDKEKSSVIEAPEVPNLQQVKNQ